MLTTKFPLNPESPYLTNDLCTAFIAEGHHVTVVNLDWTHDNHGDLNLAGENFIFYNIPRPEFNALPNCIKKLAIWATSSFIAFIKTYRSLRKNEYDVCILMTPLTIFAVFLALSKNIKAAKWIALCWDFFPLHQINLGLIPKTLHLPLSTVEAWIYSKCFRIGVLSEDYKRFIKRNYNLSKDTDIIITGLWGGFLPSSPPNKIPLGYPLNLNKTIVYGGQLAKGRGLENFITLAQVAKNVSEEITILVIGSGSMLSQLKVQLKNYGLNNIIFMDSLSRTRYTRVIEKCMAGFISLDKNTHCPSFPSKIADYLRAGLPVIAIDDLNPSIKSFIENNQIGFYIRSDDESQLNAALSTLHLDQKAKQQISQNSLNCFKSLFTPDRVVKALLKNIKT